MHGRNALFFFNCLRHGFPLSFSYLGLVLGEAKRVKEVKGHGVRGDGHLGAFERREGPGLAAAHVVGRLADALAELGPPLEEADEAHDLQLRVEGDAVPELPPKTDLGRRQEDPRVLVGAA